MAGGCVSRIHGTGGEEGFQVVGVIQNPAADFGVARPFVLAAPYFKGVGADAEIGGGFIGIELLLVGHAVSSFSVFACAGCGQAGFERKISSLKNNKILRPVGRQRKNPPGQSHLKSSQKITYKNSIL